MKSSFVIGRGVRTAGAQVRRIMALALLTTAALATLTACSTVRLAYQQAPALSQWWLNDHFDFTDAQATQVRGAIDTFYDWHRQSELPRYADLLRRWQDMARRDITASQACAQFEEIRDRVWRAGERTLAPFAQLLVDLGPEQIAALKRRQASSNQTFADDFLRGTPAERLARRLDEAVSRSERLYGRLNAQQRSLLSTGLAQSPWDAPLTQIERQRRQADLLQTIAQAQAEPEHAARLLRSHAEGLMVSPDAHYRAMSERAVRHACAQFAELHNSTTPEQREHAVAVLRGYEADLQSLSASR
ncbi:MAG: hypothetical protein KF871_06555 [Hydrogenophaga sp.]|uniref:DUF6279 family lipoprotein n=1 Tax=Hydrogenophaga sp. TaxID=1904254 RepID=UPI001DF43BEA|nr:DUF6279 family lipoprotein [Hydrogenophaga sp.]MBX3609543.1 hypothetical protein [Hydrogenophaga sp.]